MLSLIHIEMCIRDRMVNGVAVRQNEDQFVYCGSAGVGSVDIMLANKFYENAKAMGIGTKLNLWDNPLWV